MNSKTFLKDGVSWFFGYFVRTLWRDEKTGGSCFLMRTEAELRDERMYRGKTLVYDSQREQDVTYYTIFCDAAKMHVPLTDEYMPILVSGTFKTNDRGSYDFAVASIEETGDVEMMVNYLTKTYGISGARACALLKAFENDPFKGAGMADAKAVIEKEAQLSRRKAASIVNSLRQATVDRELFNLLAPLGVTYGCARRLIKEYGSEARLRLAEHPWQRGMRCGMTFDQCDGYAFANGRTPEDPERIRAICDIVITNVASAGHVWCRAEVFTELFQKFFKKGDYYPASAVKDSRAVTYAKVCGVDAVIFNSPAWAEKRIAANVARVCGSRKVNFAPGKLPDVGVTYSRQQQEAFALVETAGIKILTGGPGTGKTTTLRGIVEYFKENSPSANIRLAAPTGRAAQRLSESCGMEATTVHQLLEYRPYGDDCTHKNHDDPVDADLIVIDEMSMMNIELFDILMDAVITGTTMLLVGDTNQLEPIGAGAILHDLIAGGGRYVACHHLTEVFRQGQDSLIVQNAGLIGKGELDLRTGPDFSVIHANGPEEALETVRRLVSENHDPEDQFRCQVLCPARRGLAGVTHLNHELQELLNPDPQGAKLHYGRTSYGTGDKILMTKNNYEAGYFNGDVGVVLAVEKDYVTVDLKGETFKIHRSDLGEMSLAYAMTVHKSQGSEFDTVIISLPKDTPGMLVKNLFYTAVTRAKNRVFVVAQEDAMEMSIATESPPRRTFLAELLEKGPGAFPLNGAERREGCIISGTEKTAMT